MGDGLQQEQRGAVTAGAAVLPEAGSALPGLPARGLQVCGRLPGIADWPQPGVGRHQVRPTARPSPKKEKKRIKKMKEIEKAQLLKSFVSRYTHRSRAFLRFCTNF